MECDIQKVIADSHLATRAAMGSITNMPGTGIGGRVTISDTVRKSQTGPDGPGTRKPGPMFEEVKLTNIRRTISKAMHASLAGSAQLTHHSTFDATDILNFRKTLKSIENREDLAKVSITDIIIYATSRVLLQHRSINAHFLGDSLALYKDAHIGIAVDTPRGLLVPTIFDANKLSLTDISAQSRSLIEKCRKGAISPDMLTGASFTISNLGGFGVEVFTPVLNPPQTGLLGVCSIIERTRGGVPYPAMGLSLTYDHRALDGADAARFQKSLIEYLEKFTTNLALEACQ